MKNIFSEYINIVGYLVTGVVFFVCVSIMFNNIFNEVQSKVQYENKITHEATSKLSEVGHLLTTGQSDNDDYLTLVNKNVIEKMSNEVTEGINKVINSIV